MRKKLIIKRNSTDAVVNSAEIKKLNSGIVRTMLNMSIVLVMFVCFCANNLWARPCPEDDGYGPWEPYNNTDGSPGSYNYVLPPDPPSQPQQQDGTVEFCYRCYFHPITGHCVVDIYINKINDVPVEYGGANTPDHYYVWDTIIPRITRVMADAIANRELNIPNCCHLNPAGTPPCDEVKDPSSPVASGLAIKVGIAQCKRTWFEHLPNQYGLYKIVAESCSNSPTCSIAYHYCWQIDALGNQKLVVLKRETDIIGQLECEGCEGLEGENEYDEQNRLIKPIDAHTIEECFNDEEEEDVE